jgi:phage shock protein A
MGVFERMGRVLSANFNALLERAEDPGRSLELMLTEMQEHVRGARRELIRAVAAERQLRGKRAEQESELQRWSGRAELAVKSGDDELAKGALAQRRRVAENAARSEALLAEQRENVLEVKAAFERMQQKIAELRARQGTIGVELQIARQVALTGNLPEALGAKAGGQPFEALKDMEDRLDGVDAVFEAQREVDEALSPGRGVSGMTAAEVESRFLELERGQRAVGTANAEPSVDDELVQLKKKFRIKT